MKALWFSPNPTHRVRCSSSLCQYFRLLRQVELRADTMMLDVRHWHKADMPFRLQCPEAARNRTSPRSKDNRRFDLSARGDSGSERTAGQRRERAADRPRYGPAV